MKKSDKRGRLVIISGPSGCGKDTVVNEILRTDKNTRLSISCTTRRKRDYETDGEHYFFLDEREFKDMIAKDGFLEHADYNGKHYGTPSKKVDEQLADGKNVILVIEVKGASKVKKKRPDALMIFLAPPSREVLIKRLHNRGTETEEQIEQRLLIMKKEVAFKKFYDYEVVNFDYKIAAKEILNIIKKER